MGLKTTLGLGSLDNGNDFIGFFCSFIIGKITGYNFGLILDLHIDFFFDFGLQNVPNFKLLFLQIQVPVCQNMIGNVIIGPIFGLTCTIESYIVFVEIFVFKIESYFVFFLVEFFIVEVIES